MLNRKMVSNAKNITAFKRIQRELLRMGLNIEFVERCTSMEAILSALESNSDMPIQVAGNNIICGDVTVCISKNRVKVLDNLNLKQTMALEQDGTIVMSSKDEDVFVDAFGAVTEVRSQDDTFNAKRIMLDTGMPYVQAGVSALTYHIDDGNPEFISSAISTYYNHEQNMARYPRLGPWYMSRWGKDFNMANLEAQVLEEVLEDEEYRKQLAIDGYDEGM